MSAPGKLIDGKYELVEVAGEGGMATVYRAVVRGAAGFTRTVAVKRIRPEFRAIKNYIDMFIEEARVGSDLAHPNIVQVYDFSSDPDGAYYLIMEWVDGLDMGTWIREHAVAKTPVPWPLVAAIGIGTLRGLGAAHERRRPDGSLAPVVHRDVSPHNILLGTNGVVKLTDFGLARARDRVFSLTAPGTVKGKLCYLAPEVSWGKPAGPHSDVFSMGCVLWEGLSGYRLFDGKTDLDVFRKIRACEIPSLAAIRPDVPPLMLDTVNRALAKEPEDRFPSALALAHALADLLKSAQMGGDAQATLGSSVAEIKRRLRGEVDVSPHSQPTIARAPGPAGQLAGSVGDTGHSMEIEFSQVDTPLPPKK